MVFQARVPAVTGGPVIVEEERTVAVLTSMQIFEVPVGSTGSLLRVTCIDQDGQVVDLSGATQVLFNAKATDGTAVLQDATASLTTDGSDGKVETALSNTLVDTVRDLWCDFEVRGLASGTLITRMFVLRILDRAKVV